MLRPSSAVLSYNPATPAVSSRTSLLLSFSLPSLFSFLLPSASLEERRLHPSSQPKARSSTLRPIATSRRPLRAELAYTLLPALLSRASIREIRRCNRDHPPATE